VHSAFDPEPSANIYQRGRWPALLHAIPAEA
jgi:hypothetical protein